MKVIAILIFLTCLLSTKCNKRYYILTRFNDLHAYALKMVQLSGFNPEAKNFFRNGTRAYNYCKGLLNAPIIEIASEVGNITSRKIDKGYHTIDFNAMAELEKHFQLSPYGEMNTCYIADQSFELITFKCLDHESNLAWVSAYATNERLGLLYYTNGQKLDNLYALIDQTVRLKNFNPTIGEQFLSSLHRADSPQSELLCNLKKISQLRLCAICIDSIRRRAYIPRKQENSTRDMYADPHSNFFIDEYNGTKENCPNITVSVSGDPAHYDVHVSALFCKTLIKGTLNGFYVKLNLNNGNKVYVLMDGKIKGEAIVGQMKNILAIDAQL